MASDSLQLHKPMSEAEAECVLQQRDYDRDGALDKKELMKDMSHGHKNTNHGHHITNHGHKNTSHGHQNTNHGQKKPTVGVPKMQLSREQMKEVFRELDIDGDGCLSMSELMKAFSVLGSMFPFYKAHYGLAHADANGDGLISEEELDKLIDYAERINKRR